MLVLNKNSSKDHYMRREWNPRKKK